jgi:hypothetical protein
MEMGGYKMNLLLRKVLLSLIGLVVIGILVCGCGAANLSPGVILEANETLLSPSGNTVIECNATGIDGGNLSYNWSASGGTMHIQGGGESVKWTAPDDVGDYNITVNVTDGEGGEATASVVITVRINHLPAILSLMASEERPLSLEVCQLECRAEDPDNDSLSYNWEAEGGNISGEGAVVSWTAPEEAGSYNITVLVEDVMGGKSTTSLTINVGPNRPPVIESLVAEKTCLLTGASCNIVCTASDPNNDALSYAWSTERGSISGSGSKVKWTAPPSEDESIIIMVTVSDGRGGVASEDMVLKTVTCLCRCP